MDSRADNERAELLEQVEDWLETPLLLLSFVWLGLLVAELRWGENHLLGTAGTTIWMVFLVDFAVKFALAPARLRYLKANWLTVIALFLPALRVFRIFRVFRALRAARAVRGLRLVRLIGSANRGMRALGATMSRRGFGYAACSTLLVALLGAAGMFAFENEVPGGGLKSYSASLWWTLMLLTSLGSEYWPRTAEGRVLCLLLGIYGFTMFGYVTAALATYFVGRDAASHDSDLPGSADIAELKAEIRALRTEIQNLAR